MSHLNINCSSSKILILCEKMVKLTNQIDGLEEVLSRSNVKKWLYTRFSRKCPLLKAFKQGKIFSQHILITIPVEITISIIITLFN